MAKPTIADIRTWSLGILAGSLVLAYVLQNPRTVYIENNPSIDGVIVEVEVEVEKIVFKEPKGVIALFTFDDLVKVFIKRHPHISATNTALILDTIKATGEKYNINPIILYAIAYKESSVRWWITHSGTNDRAVGLMGIRWGIWKEGLVREGIATQRSDLYQIVPNIQASGYALSESIKLGMHKKATNKIMSGIIRYNGKRDSAEYYVKINSIIVELLKEKIYK